MLFDKYHVVEWLERLTVVRKVAKDWKTLTVNPAATSGKVKGGERRELGPVFHKSCPRQDETPLARRPLGYGHLYLLHV